MHQITVPMNSRLSDTFLWVMMTKMRIIRTDIGEVIAVGAGIVERGGIAVVGAGIARSGAMAAKGVAEAEAEEGTIGVSVVLVKRGSGMTRVIEIVTENELVRKELF